MHRVTHTHILCTLHLPTATSVKLPEHISARQSSKKYDMSVVALLYRIPPLTPPAFMSHRKPCKNISGEVEGLLSKTPSVFPFSLPTVSSAHRPQDTQRRYYKQSHIMDSHNKLTLGSGWCSTQLMPVLIRAWKYYLGLAACSKKSILSQVINSALSDCSPIPGSSMSLSWLLPLKYSVWLALSC